MVSLVPVVSQVPIVSQVPVVSLVSQLPMVSQVARDPLLPMSLLSDAFAMILDKWEQSVACPLCFEIYQSPSNHCLAHRVVLVPLA